MKLCWSSRSPDRAPETSPQKVNDEPPPQSTESQSEAQAPQTVTESPPQNTLRRKREKNLCLLLFCRRARRSRRQSGVPVYYATHSSEQKSRPLPESQCPQEQRRNYHGRSLRPSDPNIHSDNRKSASPTSVVPSHEQGDTQTIAATSAAVVSKNASSSDVDYAALFHNEDANDGNPSNFVASPSKENSSLPALSELSAPMRDNEQDDNSQNRPNIDLTPTHEPTADAKSVRNTTLACKPKVKFEGTKVQGLPDNSPVSNASLASKPGVGFDEINRQQRQDSALKPQKVRSDPLFVRNSSPEGSEHILHTNDKVSARKQTISFAENNLRPDVLSVDRVGRTGQVPKKILGFTWPAKNEPKLNNRSPNTKPVTLSQHSPRGTPKAAKIFSNRGRNGKETNAFSDNNVPEPTQDMNLSRDSHSGSERQLSLFNILSIRMKSESADTERDNERSNDRRLLSLRKTRDRGEISKNGYDSPWGVKGELSNWESDSDGGQTWAAKIGGFSSAVIGLRTRKTEAEPATDLFFSDGDNGSDDENELVQVETVELLQDAFIEFASRNPQANNKARVHARKKNGKTGLGMRTSNLWISTPKPVSSRKSLRLSGVKIFGAKAPDEKVPDTR